MHWKHWHPHKSKSFFSFVFSWHFGYDYIQPAYWCTSPYWYHYETVWFSSPVYRTIYQPVFVTTLASVSPTDPVVTAGSAPCAYSEREAWTFLAEARVEAAMGAFACLATQSPSAGMANVGYGLANALAGADGAAVAAMRLAVTLDAAALLYVPADSRLDEALIGLLDRYAVQAGDPALAVDALFMIAAIRTALHDHANAHFAVTQAIERGDQHSSASILRELLAMELHQNLYGRAPSP